LRFGIKGTKQSHFTVDPSTGVVKLKKAFDREVPRHVMHIVITLYGINLDSLL